MYFNIKTYQDKLTQLERIETNILGYTFDRNTVWKLETSDAWNDKSRKDRTLKHYIYRGCFSTLSLIRTIIGLEFIIKLIVTIHYGFISYFIACS